MCSELQAKIVTIYFTILTFISFCQFSFLFIIHWRIRQSFHPFFSILFGLIILAYGICAASVSIQRVLYLLQTEWSIIDVISEVSYAIISPLFLCCVVERAIATIFSEKYEHARPWPLLLVLIVFSCAVTYEKGYVGVEIGDSLSDNYVMIGISIAILFCLLMLVLVNQQMIRRCMISNNVYGNLTAKYQLTENVRVVRNALLPVVLFDTSITINDLIGSIAFEKDFIFSAEKCLDVPAYQYAFVIMNTVSMILELAIPLFILTKWRSYRRALPCLSCLMVRRKKISTSEKLDISTIRNVFGEPINHSITATDYFVNLQKQWN